MKTNYITIRPDKLHVSLEPLTVGRASSAVATVGGDIPDDIESLVAVVQCGENSTYNAAATKQEDGTWRIYFAPAYFPAAAENLRYDIVGMDSQGNPRWLGKGALFIEENPANGGGVVPSIIPAGSYAYNPTTGLYHRIIASVNEINEIRLDVEQEGVQL